MLIKYLRPSVPLYFDGERFTSSAFGAIEHEHLHRYLFALQFCAGKDVLDVASGEGYGSAVLAQVAHCVHGVDLAVQAIDHAKKTYRHANLNFMVGDCVDLPLPDASVDVVVSFETLEHIEEHNRYICEVRRVLRPGGILVVSTPDSDVYSSGQDYRNPFHCKELARDEFLLFVSSHFKYQVVLEQKAVVGSVISRQYGGQTSPAQYFTREKDDLIRATDSIVRPPYLIAVVSDEPLPEVLLGLYDNPGFLQRYKNRVVSDLLDSLSGGEKLELSTVFSSHSQDMIAGGQTRITRLGVAIAVHAGDADPRLSIVIAQPYQWLLLSVEFLCEDAGTAQVFTQTVDEAYVDTKTARSFDIIAGLNCFQILLMREGNIKLVRFDPIDRPGKTIINKLEIFAPAA